MYKNHVRRELAELRGKKLLSKFEDHVPSGKNHELYYYSKSFSLARCEIPDDGFHYITQRYKYNRSYTKQSFEIFAEIDLKIDPDYCYYYSLKRRSFGLFYLNDTNKEKIRSFMDSYKTDWVKTAREHSNPVNFIINDKLYRKGVLKWSKIFRKFYKIIGKRPEDPLTALNSLIESKIKRYKKYPIEFGLPIPEHVFQQLLFLNQEYGTVVEGYFDLKVPSSQKSLTILLIILTLGIFFLWIFFAFQPDMHFEPIYIIPNGDTTIIALFLPRSKGLKTKLFPNFHIAYGFLKDIYEVLNQDTGVFCTNCGLKCQRHDKFCQYCGMRL